MDRDFRVAGDQPATTDPALPAGADKVAVFVARDDLAPLLVGLADAAILARTQARLVGDGAAPTAEPERIARQHIKRAEALERVAGTVKALR